MNRLVRPFERGLCLLVVVLGGLSSTALGAESNSVSLHLRFRPVAPVTSWPVGSGPYVAFTDDRYPRYPVRHPFRVNLLNDQTGKRTVVHACGTPSVFGAQWLAFDCYTTNPKLRFQLYNVHTHRWRRLRCDRACTKYSDQLDIEAVGAKWLLASAQLPGSCGDGIHYGCGPTVHLYYNIATGRRGFPHPGPRDVLNLDSPTLTSRVCNPVSVPTGSPTVPPPLAFDRGFAFVRSPDGVYVQRCGSSRQTYLTTDPNAYDSAPFWGVTNRFFGNQHAAGLDGILEPQTVETIFSGVFLPSLRRFTATGLPKASFVVLLGPHHLYVYSLLGSTSQLMAAAFPSSR